MCEINAVKSTKVKKSHRLVVEKLDEHSRSAKGFYKSLGTLAPRYTYGSQVTSLAINLSTAIQLYCGLWNFGLTLGMDQDQLGSRNPLNR